MLYSQFITNILFPMDYYGKILFSDRMEQLTIRVSCGKFKKRILKPTIRGLYPFRGGYFIKFCILSEQICANCFIAKCTLIISNQLYFKCQESELELEFFVL